MGKYKQIGDGDILRFSRRGNNFNLSCCDCGLVHRVTVRKVNKGKDKGMIDIIMVRDNRRTGQVRRWNKHDCTYI